MSASSVLHFVKLPLNFKVHTMLQSLLYCVVNIPYTYKVYISDIEGLTGRDVLSKHVTYLYLRFVFLLQILHVNLNNVMCPALSDPFSGPYYRIIACCHQPAMMFLIGKVFCIIGHEFVALLYRTQPEKLE